MPKNYEMKFESKVVEKITITSKGVEVETETGERVCYKYTDEVKKSLDDLGAIHVDRLDVLLDFVGKILK